MSSNWKNEYVLIVLGGLVLTFFVSHHELVKKARSESFKQGVEQGIQYAENHCSEFDDEFMTKAERERYEREQQAEDAEYYSIPQYRD